MPTQRDAPIIIIGAGRSGTNILRDCLTAANGIVTWPCDEINLIWRHGNLHHPTDVFGVPQARDDVAKYIQTAFGKLAKKTGAHTVVEKTCANTLRIPFIDAIFPDARYINIVRDGRDVTASAMKRWRSSIDWPYLLRKLQYVPKSDIPHYAARFVSNRLHQMRSHDKRQAMWGPRIEGLAEAAASRPLDEVCALQWAGCVSKSLEDLGTLPCERVKHLRYEAFTAAPSETMKDVFEWLEQDKPHASVMQGFDTTVKADSIGNWKNSGLGDRALSIIEAVDLTGL